MTAKDIVLGKFWVAFYPLARELTVMLPIFVFVGFLSGVNPVSLLLVYLFNMAQVALLVIIGLYC